MSAGSVQVIDTYGDEHLGGGDFDHLFAKYLKGRFSSDGGGGGEGGVLRSTQDPSSPCTPCDSTSEMRILAERTKIHFTDEREVDCSCCRGGERLSVRITRMEFEVAVDSLIKRSVLPIKHLLDNSGVRPEEVDEVGYRAHVAIISWVYVGYLSF